MGAGELRDAFLPFFFHHWLNANLGVPLLWGPGLLLYVHLALLLSAGERLCGSHEQDNR